ncbi:LysE family translocator [Pseudoalteromonas luteoviolacea]|uniref:LysE family translocator n=1 Tax=Pseudoalteromonas luteoviolacea TaxID=43657 RepID=UPI001B373C42|nr:LysE family translocator [Pseudoalteromonas luteoviolacea]MBQ4811024.1 LysE family translocator [Pseudoalteromonas luteoviolacea]
MEQLNIVLFLTTSLVINAIPGPDVLYVISNYKYKGWKAATPSIIGLFLGYLFHVLITFIGISAVIASTPVLFSVIKYLGSAYLIWMGASIILEVFRRDGHKPDQVEQPNQTNKYLTRGFIISALNPKVSVFFLSFLPQFIPQNDKNSFVIVILGLIFCIGATFFNFLYCFLSSVKTKKVFKHKLLDYLPGVILASVGVYTAF